MSVDSLRLLEQVLDNALVAIVITDNDHKIEYVNPEFTTIFGYSIDEALDKYTYDLIIPEEFRFELERVTKGLEKGERSKYEAVRCRKDGRKIHVLCRVAPIIIDSKRLGGFAFFTDISEHKRAQEELQKAHDELEGRVEERTKELKEVNQKLKSEIRERKRIEAALRESEEQYRTAIENSNDGITIFQGKRHVYMNQKYAEMHGYESPDEIIGKSLEDLVHPDDFERVSDRARRRQSGELEGQRYEMMGLKKDGSPVPIEISVAPTMFRGKRASLAYMRDITERKRAEKELREAKEAAEKANIAKSDFLANMSHEIRTPMNAILGMTHLALQTELTGEQEEFLDAVSMSANNLLNLINDILDFSKIEAGHMELDEIDFDLRFTMDHAAETLAIKAHEKGLELTSHIKPGVSEFLVGDPGRLGQILLNLGGNALKFTEAGEVAIACGVESQDEETVLLHFTVSDTGIGVPEDKLDMIFESFKQADGSTTRKYGGTGLGLSISRHFCEMMGGKIWMESPNVRRLDSTAGGPGSTVHFTARFKIQEDKKRSALKLSPESMRDKRILIVDDNATNRMILKEVLEGWGIFHHEASEGRGALEALRRGVEENTPYDLVLMDGQMPGMDGFEVSKRIKESPLYGDTRIIMLTSLGLRGDMARCKELGIAAYLVKPIKHSDLFDALVRVWGQEGPQRTERAKEVVTRHSIREEKRRRALRILLAEDNEINQKMALKLLGNEGHTVVLANNGQEAVEHFHTDRFDLVLMDVQMPVMDGFEATDAIRNSQLETRDVPIIAMTAHALKGDRERCIEAGMDDYLSKPINPDDLAKALDRWSQEDRKTSSGGPKSDEGEDSQGKPRHEIPPLNIETALERVLGDKEFLLELLEDFTARAPEWIKTMGSLLEKRDTETLTREAHTLKGAAANLSADRIAGFALRLEEMGRSGDLSGGIQVLGELKSELESINHFVGKWRHEI
jgi:two-component system sensor histidine kinase/response regulator